QGVRPPSVCPATGLGRLTIHTSPKRQRGELFPLAGASGWCQSPRWRFGLVCDDPTENTPQRTCAVCTNSPALPVLPFWLTAHSASPTIGRTSGLFCIELARRNVMSKHTRRLEIEVLEERSLMSADMVVQWNAVALSAVRHDYDLGHVRDQGGPTMDSRALA